ncbi:MAG: glycerol kinase GlpK [Planctomycetota bacterium]
MTYLLAFDQGTTSSRAIVFDASGSVKGIAQREFEQHYPNAGWVEHDAEEIWRTQAEVARNALESCGISASDIAAIGITNQRETTVLWDRSTGEPIHHAIVWQDRRTAGLCDELRGQGHADSIADKTGLVLDAYFCATKIRWLLDNVTGAREKAERGELAFGTIDSWLIWKLTGGRVHVTDVTNASRTMLLNLETCDWDDSLLQLFDIPSSILPQVRSSSEVYGETEASLFGHAIPIAGIAGDQQAALFGQNCTRNGMAKNTYGTGCFLLMNVGQSSPRSKNRLLTTLAAKTGDSQTMALEGSVFVAGAAVQWLRDGLGIINSSSDIEALAASVPDSGDVYMVPALAGLGAPQWDSYARGTIVGLTRGTTKAHIARATLEGIAFQVADVFDAMKKDSGLNLEELRVDGGAAANDLLMQIQADILQTRVVRPKVIETTAMGAAFLAGIGVGIWKDASEIESIWQTDREFEPSLSPNDARRRRERWNEALRRSMGWCEQE